MWIVCCYDLGEKKKSPLVFPHMGYLGSTKELTLPCLPELQNVHAPDPLRDPTSECLQSARPCLEQLQSRNTQRNKPHRNTQQQQHELIVPLILSITPSTASLPLPLQHTHT